MLHHRPRRGSVPGRTLLACALLAVLASACRVPIGVDRVGADRVRDQLEASSLTGDIASTATLQTLVLLGLMEAYEDDPDAVLLALRQEACASGSRDALFALAELYSMRAREGGARRDALAAALCAYWYLLDPDWTPEPDPFDRRFRLACDIYNRGLGQALDNGTEGQARFSGRFELPGGSMRIELDRSRLPFGEDLISRFVLADDYEVRGLLPRNRDFGLGAPMIGLPAGDVLRGVPYMPPKLNVSTTAFLRVEGRLADWDGGLSGTLELHPALDVPHVEVDGRRIPLETDQTAALAYALETSPVWDFEVAGFLQGATQSPTGLFMVQPYQPGKIPVVLVHGTASSPARWAPMFNGLFADPVLRSRCQFWFFTYTTGNPIAYSGALLREALADVVQHIDPEGRDPALSTMVVVGHSQGGLLTHMTASTSGDSVWTTLTDQSFDDLDLEPASRELLQRCLFWERVPQVTRVVYVATPHQGSFLSAGLIGRLAARLVTLPSTVKGAVTDLLVRNEARLPPEVRGKIPTAIDNMTEKNPFLGALAALPADPGVRSHSIVAVEGDGPPEEGNDGVVAFSSAHRDDVDSELVVSSGHSCQAHPIVIREVGRILREHVAAWDQSRVDTASNPSPREPVVTP